MKKLAIQWGALFFAAVVAQSSVWIIPSWAANNNDCGDGSITIINNTTDSNNNPTTLLVTFNLDNGGYLSASVPNPAYIGPQEKWAIPPEQTQTKGTVTFGNSQNGSTFSFNNAQGTCQVAASAKDNVGLKVTGGQVSGYSRQIIFTVSGRLSNESSEG